MLAIVCVLQPDLYRCSFLLLGLKGGETLVEDEEVKMQKSEKFF